MLLPLAYLFYGIVIVAAVFRPTSVTFNGKPVNNPLLRIILLPCFFLFVGIILTLAGFVGRFLLLPVIDLF